MTNLWYKMGSPQSAYLLLGRVIPWVGFLCAGFMLYGAIGGLYLAPPDYQQGDGFRMIYIHVPAAFLSLGIYTIIFIQSVIFRIWHIKLADSIAKESALIGALYTLIALVSGSLWGKPMWGTFWIWDARLTSELLLLFLYGGYIALRVAIRDKKRAQNASALLAIVGMIDIPIIHFSVEWWATLHQGPTLAKFAKPSIAPAMLYPLLSMMVAFGFFYVLIVCMRIRIDMIKREGKTQWMQAWLSVQGSTDG